MPANAKVFLHYGPYESCGLVEYNLPRLEGLQNVLQLSGHSVELTQIAERNVVELWVNGEMVFQCTLTDLDFGGDGKLDQLCTEALEKVAKAF